MNLKTDNFNNLQIQYNIEDLFNFYSSSYCNYTTKPLHKDNQGYECFKIEEKCDFLKEKIEKNFYNIDIDKLFQKAIHIAEKKEIETILQYNPNIYKFYEKSKLQTPSIFIAIGTRNLPIVKTLINSQNQFNYQIHVYNQDLLVHSIYKNNLEVSEFLAFNSPFDFNIEKKYLNSLFFSIKKNKRIKPIDNYKHLAGTIGEKILLEYANKGFDFFSPIPELEQSIFDILTTEKNIPNSLLETMNTISQLKTLGQIKEANKQNKKKGI